MANLGEWFASQLTRRNIKISAVAFAAVWVFILAWRIVGALGTIKISDGNLNNLITSGGLVLVALISLHNNVLARRNDRQNKRTEEQLAGAKLQLAEAKQAIEKTQTAVEKVAHETNSMKDALVKVTGEAAFARGVKQGDKEGPDAKDPRL